jgi:hypothetical protein
LTLIATASEEMQIAPAGKAPQISGHGNRLKTLGGPEL